MHFFYRCCTAWVSFPKLITNSRYDIIIWSFYLAFIYIYIYIYIYANFIKHNRHFMSTYFLLDPFKFLYYFYCILGELIYVFPQNTIKVIREFERIQKKICRHKMSIMFNEICINEEMLPKYTYIYIYKVSWIFNFLIVLYYCLYEVFLYYSDININKLPLLLSLVLVIKTKQNNNLV